MMHAYGKVTEHETVPAHGEAGVLYKEKEFIMDFTSYFRRNRKWVIALLALAAVLTVPCLTEAAEKAPEYTPKRAVDTVWTMVGAMLVMFMQPGFALVECGLTRAKNAANITMKNFADFGVGAICFFVLGFGLMFGDSLSGIIGTNLFCLSGNDPTTDDGMWTLTFFFFQSVFCATSATIVSGGIAERMKFSGYLLVSMLVSLIVYPISGHWAWNGLFGAGGWLGNLGFIDFAGSSVVHSVGGAIALAGAIVLGPRIGKYSKDGKARAILGHNLPMAGLGVFILWFAWFGFNCGSTTAADMTLGIIAVNTNLAACAAFCTSMLTVWCKTGKPDPSMCFNGVLAGLVGITAGCAEVSPVGAICIGAICGFVVVCSVFFIDQKLHIDDPCGAASVHGVCGFLGSTLVGFFAAPGYGTCTGLLYGGGFHPLAIQLLGAACYVAWAFICGLIIFKIVDAIMGIRPTPEEELKGMDITEHGTDAYSGFQIFTNE